MSTRALLWLAVLAAFVPAASATTIDISTSNGLWTFSGAGATDAPAFVLANGGISFSDNAHRTGNFAPGASLGAFDGFWTATFSFFVPATATDVSGQFSNLIADDRVLLFFNGSLIGAGGLGIPPSGDVNGFIEYTDGGGDQPFTYNSGETSGSGSNGFILGGTNTLFAVINNTAGGVTGMTKGLSADGDAVAFHLSGSVTFAPEPGALPLTLAGCAALVLYRVLRKAR